MIKNTILFLWIIIVPMFLILWKYFFQKEKNIHLKKKTLENLNFFQDVFTIITISSIPFLVLLSDGVSSPFSTVLLIEVCLFDVLSAICFLIAMRWQIGILSLIFFPTHIMTISDLLWDDLIPKEIVAICVFLYPIISWIQFKHTIFTKEDKGSIFRRKN